jgi:hypothetical protein
MRHIKHAALALLLLSLVAIAWGGGDKPPVPSPPDKDAILPAKPATVKMSPLDLEANFAGLAEGASPAAGNPSGHRGPSQFQAYDVEFDSETSCRKFQLAGTHVFCQFRPIRRPVRGPQQ